MTNVEKQELELIHERARQWSQSLTPEQRIERLKRLGILDAKGTLSSRYGGEGEDTSQPRPSAH